MITKTKLIELESEALARLDRRMTGQNDATAVAARNTIRELISKLHRDAVDDTQTNEPNETD